MYITKEAKWLKENDSLNLVALHEQMDWDTERYDDVVEKIGSLIDRGENYATITDVDIDADNYANVSVPALDNDFCLSFPVSVEVSIRA